jgi:serine/threonine protein kinase
MWSTAEREIILASRMHHPNVVTMFGTCISKSTNEAWLVMEYADEGSLYSSLADKPQVNQQLVLECTPGDCNSSVFCRRFLGVHGGSGQLKQPQQWHICTSKE